jgi:hypothetical protein
MRIIFIFFLFIISCKKEDGVLPQNSLDIKTNQVYKVKTKKIQRNVSRTT